MTPITASAPTQIPGISPDARVSINIRSREIITAAVMAGQRVERLVLVVDGTDVRLEPRADVVTHYKACGVARLAKALERLNVPRDQVAVLVVADDVGLMVVALSTLGIDPSARHSTAYAATPLSVVAPAPPRTTTRPAKNTEPATRRSGPAKDNRRTSCAPRHATDARDVIVHRPGVPSGNKRATPGAA